MPDLDLRSGGTVHMGDGGWHEEVLRSWKRLRWLSCPGETGLGKGGV